MKLKSSIVDNVADDAAARGRIANLQKTAR